MKRRRGGGGGDFNNDSSNDGEEEDEDIENRASDADNKGKDELQEEGKYSLTISRKNVSAFF
jgi:hypothetical protein